MIHTARNKPCNRRADANARRGAAVTEFALIAPLLVLITMGAIDVGHSINVSQVINDASREGARHASRDTVTTATEVETFVRQFVADAFPYLTSEDMQAALVVEVGDADGIALPYGDLTAVDSGAPVSVTVDVQFGFMQFTSVVPGYDQLTIRTTTVMRRE